MTEQDTPIATIVGLTPPNDTAPSYSLHQVIPRGRFLLMSAAITRIEHRIENRGDHGIGWYDVYCGAAIVASVNEREVGYVIYDNGGEVPA